MVVAWHSYPLEGNFKSFAFHLLVFDFCASFNLSLHLAKSTLFTTAVRRCGRLISQNVMSFDPQRIDDRQDMSFPKAAAGLQQFVYAMPWLRAWAPHFYSALLSIWVLLEEFYKAPGKRTGLAVRNVFVESVHWASLHQDFLLECKCTI